MTNYPTYQGTFIGSGGDINHGIRIESDGISISDTVEENAGHPDDRHSRIGAGYFDMYNGTHELVWLEGLWFGHSRPKKKINTWLRWSLKLSP